MPSALAHTLDSLIIDIVLEPNGDAYIEEYRKMYIGSTGSECFIKFYNMDDMKVSLYGVSDDDGPEFTVERRNWDTKRPRREKTNRCGINHVDEGVEICWGVGAEGMHRYRVRYRISGLVTRYTDACGFNHNIYEADDPAAKFVEAHVWLDSKNFRDVSMEPSKVHAWASGFHGKIDFGKDYLTIRSISSFYKDYKMILMMSFPAGKFKDARKKNKKFADVKARALKGSSYEQQGGNGTGQMTSVMGGDSRTFLEKYGPMALLFLFIVGCGVIGILPSLLRRRRLFKLIENAPQYQYELPRNGSLTNAFHIARDMDMISGDKPKALIGAMFMWLLNHKQIKYVGEDEGSDVFVNRPKFKVSDPENFTLDVSGLEESEHRLIKRFLRVLYYATDSNNYLRLKLLKDSVRSKSEAVKTFFEQFKDVCSEHTDTDVVLATDVRELHGFYEYLNDFTLMKERAVREVSLWGSYLTYATLFGIAHKVRSFMMEILPDLDFAENADVFNSSPFIYATTDSIADFAYALSSDFGSAFDSAYGDSSFGGGGGASGGGGSGVR